MNDSKRRLLSVLFGCLALASLGGTSSAQIGPPRSLRPPNEPVAEPLVSRYMLDLSESEHGGVLVGKFNNLAFRLNLREPVTRLAVRAADQQLSDLVATFDYADCTKGQESLLERTLGTLERGDEGWVDTVEVEIIPPRQRDAPSSGGVCYGYRSGGRWYWNLASIPLTFDASTDRMRARIPVQRGSIDAIKLVFDHTLAPQFVSRVLVTTRPINATPDP